jgi:CII-binding regulator of phage lambda lysogenization HflD
MTQGSLSVDPLVADLDVIALAQRILTNRIAELEAELARQAAVTETLRQRLAGAMHENLKTAAEARTVVEASGERLAVVQAAADARARELAALRATVGGR